MFEQRLILGDTLTKLAEIGDETHNMIIADPPYNLGKDYGNNRRHQGVCRVYSNFPSYGFAKHIQFSNLMEHFTSLWGSDLFLTLYDIIDRQLSNVF